MIRTLIFASNFHSGLRLAPKQYSGGSESIAYQFSQHPRSTLQVAGQAIDGGDSHVEGGRRDVTVSSTSGHGHGHGATRIAPSSSSKVHLRRFIRLSSPTQRKNCFQTEENLPSFPYQHQTGNCEKIATLQVCRAWRVHGMNSWQS